MGERSAQDRHQPGVFQRVAPGDEPYYPVNDRKNGTLYAAYQAMAEKEAKVLFGGRLGEYKYYDMDAVIAAALKKSQQEMGA